MSRGLDHVSAKLHSLPFRAMILFSTLKVLFLGYFDPEYINFEKKQPISGQPSQDIGYNKNTGSDCGRHSCLHCFFFQN